jgi:hypothetical protein
MTTTSTKKSQNLKATDYNAKVFKGGEYQMPKNAGTRVGTKGTTFAKTFAGM